MLVMLIALKHFGLLSSIGYWNRC